MNRTEKRIIWVLLAIAFISGGFILRQAFYKHQIPNYGGTFTEGTLASSESDLNESLNRLTKIGLTKFDNKGNIVPDLAESWQISADGLNYSFKLRSVAKSDDVIKVIRDNKKEWADINITKIDDSSFKFDLKQPLGPFLARTTEPLFDYGPYKISKTTKTEIILNSNKSFWSGTPYINTFVLKLYADPNSLADAVKGKKVDGALLSDQAMSGYSKLDIAMPKYKMVFFNTASPDLVDKAVREKIAQNQNIGKEISLRLAVSNDQADLDLAGDLSQKWASLGVKLAVTPYDPTDLEKTIIPNRDYDVLLYGIDYGTEEDPYIFFHSSQISADGLNYSNFSNKDADKILEDARLTTDSAARKQKYQDFKKIFDDQAPAIVLSQEDLKYFVSSKVSGIDPSIYAITAGDRFETVSRWYLKIKKVK